MTRSASESAWLTVPRPAVARSALSLALVVLWASIAAASPNRIGRTRLFQTTADRTGVLAEAGTYDHQPAKSSGEVAQGSELVSTTPTAEVEELPTEAPDAHTFTSYLSNNVCTLVFDRITPYRPYDFGPNDAQCRDPQSDPNRRRRSRGPDIAAIVQGALDRAIALAADPDLNIAPARLGLTGLPTYVWDGDPPAPITVTASAGGVTVVAEAQVTHYRWDFGEDIDMSTSPGRPWTKAHNGTIDHTYETKGFYDLSVEAIWAARWRLGAEPWQSLGYFSTSDSRRYPVQEVVTRLVPTSAS
jgi:hypothetical protein